MKALTNRNYDNRELGPDEELVLYFINEADIESYINPLSIIRWHVGRVTVKAAWTAFKKGADADIARKQFYYYVRDLNGQFHCKNALSTDAAKDNYGLDEGTFELDPAGIAIRIDNFKCALQRLMDEAPQYLAALIFLHEGLEGTDYQKAMRVGSTRGYEIRQEVRDIMYKMKNRGYDQVFLKARKTKHDGYYREVCRTRVNALIDTLSELYFD